MSDTQKGCYEILDKTGGKPVTIIKCNCCETCSTYYLSVGTFYQGCGFSKDMAEAIVAGTNNLLTQYRRFWLQDRKND